MITAALPTCRIERAIPATPVPLPTGDAAADLRALDECLASNRLSISTAEDLIKSSGRELTTLQARIAQEQATFQTTLRSGQTLLEELTQLRKTRNFIMLAAGAGVAFLTINVVPGLALAGALVGGFASAVSVALVSKADGRLTETRIQRNGIEADITQATAAAGNLMADVKDLRLVVTRAEKAIHEADDRAQVLRMAQALDGQSHGGSVAVEEEMLIVGGVRVPRKKPALHDASPSAPRSGA